MHMETELGKTIAPSEYHRVSITNIQYIVYTYHLHILYFVVVWKETFNKQKPCGFRTVLLRVLNVWGAASLHLTFKEATFLVLGFLVSSNT